jgi:hypothetical protein
MLGFKSTASAATILSGIEMVHIMRKQQARYTYNSVPSLVILAEQRLRKQPSFISTSSLRQSSYSSPYTIDVRHSA